MPPRVKEVFPRKRSSYEVVLASVPICRERGSPFRGKITRSPEPRMFPGLVLRALSSNGSVAPRKDEEHVPQGISDEIPGCLALFFGR